MNFLLDCLVFNAFCEWLHDIKSLIEGKQGKVEECSEAPDERLEPKSGYDICDYLSDRYC